MSKIKKFFDNPGEFFQQLVNDPVQQYKALTSGDITQTGKALFAPSLITQQTPGALADGTRLADTVIASYFGGPLGGAGAEALHSWNEGATIGDALKNGAISGLTSYVAGKAANGIGGMFDGSSAAEGAGGVTTQAGYEGAPMSVPSSNMSSLTTGSGVTAGGGSSAMNFNDALKLGGTIYSGVTNANAIDEQKKQLLDMQNKASSLMSPYANAGNGALGQLSNALTRGFTPGDLTQDAGYQFSLDQGQKALQSQLAAQGLGQSGAAVKAATEYGTGLASKTYDDAHSRWLAQNQQLAGLTGIGSNAASSLGNIYGNIGALNSRATGASQEALNKMINGVSTNPLTEALLRGSGMFS